MWWICNSRRFPIASRVLGQRAADGDRSRPTPAGLGPLPPDINLQNFIWHLNPAGVWSSPTWCGTGIHAVSPDGGCWLVKGRPTVPGHYRAGRPCPSVPPTLTFVPPAASLLWAGLRWASGSPSRPALRFDKRPRCGMSRSGRRTALFPARPPYPHPSDGL